MLHEVQVFESNHVGGFAPAVLSAVINLEEVVTAVPLPYRSQRSVMKVTFRNGESLEILGHPKDLLRSNWPDE